MKRVLLVVNEHCTMKLLIAFKDPRKMKQKAPAAASASPSSAKQKAPKTKKLSLSEAASQVT